METTIKILREILKNKSILDALYFSNLHEIDIENIEIILLLSKEINKKLSNNQ